MEEEARGGGPEALCVSEAARTPHTARASGNVCIACPILYTYPRRGGRLTPCSLLTHSGRIPGSMGKRQASGSMIRLHFINHCWHTAINPPRNSAEIIGFNLGQGFRPAGLIIRLYCTKQQEN